jgi:hypothetical protein
MEDDEVPHIATTEEEIAMEDDDDEVPHIVTTEEEIGVLIAASAIGNIDIEKEIELTYLPMQTLSNKTRAGHSSGLKSMDVFCQLQKIKKMSEYKTADFDDPEVCNQIQFNLKCFCTFMLTAKSNRGTHYMPGSQAQMLSNVFNYLHKAHPAVKMFDKDKYPVESKWYTELLHGLKRNGFGNAIKRGESVGDKAIGIRRKLLAAIIQQLIKEERYKEASAVCTLYHAVGRGGEVADMNFATMKWDTTFESLWGGWAEVKTTHYTDLSFFANVLKYGYATCYMWTFGAYIIMEQAGGALRTQLNMPDFVYPDYQKLRGSASSKVTAAISTLFGKVDGLLKEHTSHGLRVGATDDMLSNNFCHLVCAIARGAWDCIGLCMIFSYYTKNLHVSTSGKALAGVPDCRQHHSMPTLDALPEGIRGKINHMAELLFMFAPDAFKANGHLLLARDALLAVQLMWIHRIASDYGTGNGLFKKLVEKATVAQITVDELFEYGILIRARYEADFIRNQGNSEHCIQGLRESIKYLTNMLNHQMAQLRQTARTLTGAVQTVNEKVDTVDEKVDKLHEQNVTLLQQNATLTSTVNDLRDELFKLSNNFIRIMSGAGMVVDNEMSHDTANTTSTKRPRVSLGGGADAAVIDLSNDDSEKKQAPPAKIQKVNSVKEGRNKPKSLSQSLLVPISKKGAAASSTNSLRASQPLVQNTNQQVARLPRPSIAAASSTNSLRASQPVLPSQPPALTHRPVQNTNQQVARLPRPSIAIDPAQAQTAFSFGLIWTHCMKLHLAQFLIQCSMYSFPAFIGSQVLGDVSKQVKNKLKMVYNVALKFADQKQKQILNKPRVKESDQYGYRAYIGPLSLVCDELAILVYAHVVTNNPLVQGVEKNKAMAPSQYNNLKVSYTYTRLEQIKQEKKKNSK